MARFSSAGRSYVSRCFSCFSFFLWQPRRFWSAAAAQQRVPSILSAHAFESGPAARTRALEFIAPSPSRPTAPLPVPVPRVDPAQRKAEAEAVPRLVYLFHIADAVAALHLIFSAPCVVCPSVPRDRLPDTNFGCVVRPPAALLYQSRLG